MTGITPASLLQMRSQILQQNSALQKAAGAEPAGLRVDVPAGPDTVRDQPDFAGALKGALNQVSSLQDKASDISAAYERGDVTDIAQVMLTREQASVGFQATLQVRNKLLSAYKDIMSMPV